MATESVIFTVLPNGHDRNGRLLRFTVFVSPRLFTDGAGDLPLRGAGFDAFEDWPAALAETRFFLTVDGLGTFDAEPDPSSPAAESATWHLLFDACRVRDGKFNDLSDRRFLSFPVGEMAKAVMDLYTEVAEGSHDQFPPLSTGPVAGLAKELGMLGGHGRERYYKMLDDRMQRHEGGRYLDRSQISAGQRRFLAFAEAYRFYDRPGSRDPAGENAAPAEPEPPKIDFHGAVATVGDYPELLRRLGLAVDLVCRREGGMQPEGRLRVEVRGPALRAVDDGRGGPAVDALRPRQAAVPARVPEQGGRPDRRDAAAGEHPPVPREPGRRRRQRHEDRRLRRQRPAPQPPSGGDEPVDGGGRRRRCRRCAPAGSRWRAMRGPAPSSTRCPRRPSTRGCTPRASPPTSSPRTSPAATASTSRTPSSPTAGSPCTAASAPTGWSRRARPRSTFPSAPTRASPRGRRARPSPATRRTCTCTRPCSAGTAGAWPPSARGWPSPTPAPAPSSRRTRPTYRCTRRSRPSRARCPGCASAARTGSGPALSTWPATRCPRAASTPSTSHPRTSSAASTRCRRRSWSPAGPSARASPCCGWSSARR